MQTLAVPTRHVDDDGTARIVGVLTRDGAEHQVTVTVNDDGDVLLLAESPAGVRPLQIVGAWSNR